MVISGLLEDVVVGLDAGVDEDRVEVWEVGQNALNFGLQGLEVRQVPLNGAKSDH
jgi:hypothetical protein